MSDTIESNMEPHSALFMLCRAVQHAAIALDEQRVQQADLNARLHRQIADLQAQVNALKRNVAWLKEEIKP